MSRDWKCAICGTTMLSKCPDQRSVFLDPRSSIINSLVTVDKVDSVNNTAELFISYTGQKDLTAGQMFKNLISLMTEDPGTLDNLGCSHVWVLNSDTETKCALGCEHNNLTHIDEIKAEQVKVPQTVEGMLRGYSKVATAAIELARRELNISKQVFDKPVESDFQHAKETVRTHLSKIADGEHLKKPYRVRIPGATWRDDSHYVFFDTLEDATRYCVGLRLLSPGVIVDLCKISDCQEYYETVEFQLAIPCAICGKITDDELVIRKDGSVAHVTCANKERAALAVKRRSATVNLGTMIHALYSSNIERQYGLTDCYVYSKKDDSVVLRIFKTCTKAELDSTVAAITEEYASR